jgi:cytochrome c-type biogenesis protein
MIAGVGVYGLSLIAGVLSTLSPCVVPLLPILVGSALAAHRNGPMALAAGLALAYTVSGIFLATVGMAIGLDQSLLRNVAAVLSVAIGLVLLSEAMQLRFTGILSGVTGGGQPLLERIPADSLKGQFLLGGLLGILWSPCVGPTLGAALLLASQGRDLLHVSVVMALFGFGAALPLAGMGLLSQQAMLGMKSKLLSVGKSGKQFLGTLLLLLGVLVITGLDKILEAWVLAHAPDWMNNLTIAI